MSKSERKPLSLSAAWISYAHGPGAESGQPLAIELCDLAVQSGRVHIPVDRLDMAREVISVAGLYTSYSVDADDRKRAARAIRVIARCREWLYDGKGSW